MDNIDFINKEIENFSNDIGSLKDWCPFGVLIIISDLKKCIQDFETFLQDECVKDSDDEFSIPIEKNSIYRQKKESMDKARCARKLLPRSLFVTTISQYDLFISKIIRFIFMNNPELLLSNEKTFTFKDLQEHKTLDDFKINLIDKEIETFLRKSHSDQLDYISKTFSIKIDKSMDVIKNFIEATERRNIFVHNDGIVNTQYLTTCKLNNITTDKELKIGSSLDFQHTYFINIYETLCILGIMLSNILWRKYFPDRIDEADKSINTFIYELIIKEQYDFASKVLDLYDEFFSKKSSSLYKSMMTINRAQAYKWSGKSNICNDIMNKFDCSDKSIEFKLAKEVLTENWDKAISIVNTMGTTSNIIGQQEYKEWPLFKELRSRADFIKTYENIFKEKFEEKIKPDAILNETTSDGKDTISA